MQATKERTMLTPAQLREHQTQLKIVQSSSEAARFYLGAEERYARAGQEMKQSFRSALECGAALAWIKEQETYLDGYTTWAAFCRAEVRLSYSHVYRLMRAAKLLATTDPELIGSISTPLSFRSLEAIGETSDPDENPDIVDEIAEGFEDAETPKTVRDAGATWVSKAPHLLSWFQARGKADAARGHIEALIKLAEEAGAGRAKSE